MNISRRHFTGLVAASSLLPFSAAAHGTSHDTAPQTSPKANLDMDQRFDIFKTADGEQFNPGDLQGKPTILFFGFASCGDVCPTAMANIASALESSGGLSTHNVVMVTTVPTHESSETTQAFLNNFSEGFIGLAPFTDSEIFGSAENKDQRLESVQAIFDAFGVIRDGHHSPFAYLMDEQGAFVRIFSTQQMKPDMIPTIAP